MDNIFEELKGKKEALIGKVLASAVYAKDEETGEGLRVGLQLNGEILNQAVEVDLKTLEDDLIEMRHIDADGNDIIIEIL